MPTIVSENILTLTEYFELEKNSEIRREFIHGELIAMLGESKIANKIALNSASTLKTVLKGKKQEVFIQDVRLMVNPTIYRYPDVVVASTEDVADTHAITQPSLIVEVLSESTEITDRTEKLHEYCRLASLHYYLLISQVEYLVEMYRLVGTDWVYTFFDKLTDVLNLDFYPAELTLGDIYEGIAP
jgi:Uma2 family endonuclease